MRRRRHLRRPPRLEPRMLVSDIEIGKPIRELRKVRIVGVGTFIGRPVVRLVINIAVAQLAGVET